MFRHGSRDALVAGLGLAVCAGPSALALVIPRPDVAHAVGLAAALAIGWTWAQNTLAHIHLHTPIFASPRLSRAFSMLLTAGTFVPQTWWKRQHLAHHAGERAAAKRIVDAEVVFEILLVAAVALAFAVAAPRFALIVLLPAWLASLALAQVSGVYEHRVEGRAVEAGVSMHGRLHNWLWLNDGLHAEHHAAPGRHWTELRPSPSAATSALPPMARWLSEPLSSHVLCALERLVLRSPRLAAWVVDAHARALAELVPAPPSSVLVVGGGLFPRSALVVARLFPDARVTILDRSATHLEVARDELARRGVEGVALVEGTFSTEAARGFDLVIVPLAFVGELGRLPAPTVVHEWIGTPGRGPRARVALSLWKRARRIDP